MNDNYSKMSSQEKKDKHGLPGEHNGMFGRTHSEKARKSISDKNKGVSKNLGFKHSDEMKKKLSDIAKTRIGDKNPFYGKGVAGVNNPSFGRKHTDEFKKQISDRNKGKTPTTIVGITIDNVRYDSLTEASKKLQIPLPTILWRVKSKNNKFDNYEYTEITNQKLLSTKISINNIEYNSVLEACKKLKFGSEYITKRLKSNEDEDKEWKILDKPRDRREKVGKRVSINDVVYNSIKEASLKLGIPEVVLAKRLNSKEPMPVTPKKRISIDNNVYDSVTEASKQLNKNINVLIKHLKSDNEKWKSYYYLPIEYIDLSKYKYL
jgi:ribosome-binding protein aMBF1 (putative translation factor)